MLEVAIVEDDAKDMNDLVAALDRYGDETGETVKAYTYRSCGAFLGDGCKRLYDAVFLDIELPNGNGMELAADIRKADEHVPIIFVTNAARYAVQGYKVGALDYFLKPVGYYDLKLRMDYIRTLRKKSEPTVTIAVPHLKKRVAVSDIYYIEVFGHEIVYHTKDGELSVSRDKSLKNVEKELESTGFKRCSACYLVNLMYCTELRGDTVVCGKTGAELKIGRSCKKEFMTALSEYVVTSRRGGGAE